MVIRFIHAASLLLSLFHFAHEGGSHPNHAHAVEQGILAQLNNRRHIMRAL